MCRVVRNGCQGRVERVRSRGLKFRSGVGACVTCGRARGHLLRLIPSVPETDVGVVGSAIGGSPRPVS